MYRESALRRWLGAPRTSRITLAVEVGITEKTDGRKISKKAARKKMEGTLRNRVVLGRAG